MQFPHLSDTTFPNLPTVNVYQFQNTFDYSRWSEKTKVKLCNVLWNSDYADVVKWDTNAMRDEWFDSLTDFWATELQTSARVVPEGYVKLPIPYDVMARYNYLFIDMPIATSANNPLDYENASGVRRWYFFINNIQYLAPNATQAYVIPDVWTNFQNDIDITYLLLERGHAPVAATDAATYLADPIANNRYLLAPDVNYDNAGITRSSSFVPFGNGTKYVCFATTCSPDLLPSLGTVVANPAYDPTGTITYSDVDVRYGHQLQVNGYVMGNGYDYSDARTPAAVGYSDGLIANNLTVYAIPATECYGSGTFLADVLRTCPQFLTTVKACFVVDDACITRGTAHAIAGHTVYQCVGKSSTLLQKALTIADFDYPEELQRFAKLYTAPYAKLEITDNDGRSYDVNIEETTTLTVKSVVSVAFPYINERVYIEGIGGVGAESYRWVDMNGNTELLAMPDSDWFKYCFDWGIPTFALYMDGQTAFMLESFNRNVKQAIRQGLVSYHNTMRSANTAYENVVDQSDVAYANTIRNAVTALNNAYRSADTARTNADRIAATNRTNADAAADTAKTNADNAANTEKTNADNAADVNKTNADNSADLAYNTIDRTCTMQSQNLTTANATTAANEEMGITGSSQVTSYTNQGTQIAASYANAMVQYTTSADVERSTATTANSNVGSILSSALGGAQAGVVMGGVGGASIGAVTLPVVGTVPGSVVGALGGAVVGAVGGGISAATNSANLGVTTNTAQSIANAQADYNTDVASNNAQQASLITGVHNSVRRTVYLNNADSSVTQMDNSNATSRANATAARDTAKTNATNAQSTTKTNATNSQNTAKTNASNTQAVTKENAARTKTALNENNSLTRQISRLNAEAVNSAAEIAANDTKVNVQSNAWHTRNVSELNAKEILENGRAAATAAMDDARNAAPIEVCQYSGNPQADYMRTRGVQIKVKTQSDSAIRQTGDAFARFGYALNQVWDAAASGLKLMRHFTYWKASEIWVDDRESSTNMVNTFVRNMFLNGVTVWNDPTEIGRVNVYDN